MLGTVEDCAARRQEYQENTRRPAKRKGFHHQKGVLP
jgi:hypothetical protein